MTMETDRTDLPGEVESGAGNKIDVAEIERLAEERGYLRGRNERIEQLMGEPGLWQPLHPSAPPDTAAPEPAILQNLRRDIWD